MTVDDVAAQQELASTLRDAGWKYALGQARPTSACQGDDGSRRQIEAELCALYRRNSPIVMPGLAADSGGAGGGG